MPAPNLYYKLSGQTDKPAIVFLHGFPFNHSMWAAQAALCQSKFQVLTYDQRGHGQSDTGNGQYIFEFFVDDLFRLLDMAKIKKAILCGLSMGGYIALRAVQRQPERVNGLILCDTRSEADSDAAKLNRAVDLGLIQESGVPAFAEKFLTKALAPSTIKEHPSVVEHVRQMIVSNPSVGIQGTLIALATRTDTTSFLSDIRVPTLIMVGNQDPITPPSAAESMQSRIAGSRLATIPKAAHLSNLENADAFNTAFLTFLKSF